MDSKRPQWFLTFSGMLPTKNEYLPSFVHVSLSFSRSNISPIGIPQLASNHSCSMYFLSTCGPTGGLRSKEGASPATAANWWSLRKPRVASDDSVPPNLALGRSARSCCSSSVKRLKAAVKLDLRKRISPGLKLMLCSWMSCSRWLSGIWTDSKGFSSMVFSVAQHA